ncbi:MAG: hypothetical protein HOU81_01250 [Hamadaea sp.]|uniref:hypothetical protein n=1 Tax=Hamadaea sp. TaxID=2024425 RepID=UPI0017CB2DDB|nr:hypothetical protein [Hamadaea sp.]NUR69424.1 hypothetical protein [Hamadaea sp.]NUT23839.1 hypothetical protein [Hamadaea sp.]
MNGDSQRDTTLTTLAAIATVIGALCTLGPLSALLAVEHEKPSREGYAPLMNDFYLGATVAVALTAASIAVALWSWRFRSGWLGALACLLFAAACGGGLWFAGIR